MTDDAADTSQRNTGRSLPAFALGGYSVRRLGFGTMQLTGPGVWGPPADRATAVKVLRRASELGVNLIDTADSYGPDIAEPLIREALHPYPSDLVIATKAGLTRQGPNLWNACGRPEYLRGQAERSLRHLGLDCIPLFQLHRIDRKVPFDEQVGALADLQREGKIVRVGLSGVSMKQLVAANRIVRIDTVQNCYNLADRSDDDVLDHAEQHGIGYIPWFPLATGSLSRPDGPLRAAAAERSVTPSQLALAWLLARSPVVLPIPGTSSVEHLEENVAAASVELRSDDVASLAAAVPSARRPNRAAQRLRGLARRLRR